MDSTGQAASEHLGPIAGAVEEAVAVLGERGALRRTWEGDHTLWQDDPTEVADRLGWLHSPAGMGDRVGELVAFTQEVAAAGLTHAVLMGMGGSSLFPAVLARTFGLAEAALDLAVLDSTDPGAVRRVEQQVPLDRTLFVAASKSGSTLETLSHLDYFRHLVPDAGRFAAITDPGSGLARRGEEEGFRRVFENRPDVGGRYSALTHFGLVPGALLGIDPRRLLEPARAMADASAPDADPAGVPAVRLGAALGAAVRAGRDKVTIMLPDEVATFGLWLEQLLAESTGKQGTGVVPVVGEPLGPAGVYGDDRLFVAYGHRPGLRALVDAGHPVIELAPLDPAALGAEVFRWELATALSGVVLGINPFDQPDVAAAKEATSRVLEEGLSPVPTEPLPPTLATLRAGDYVAFQAYVDPEAVEVSLLQAARMTVRDHYHVATTLGIGPRFLHSTGQLHKGGPATVVAVQVVGADAEEVPIPGRAFGFSTLKHAQAAGDLRTLRDRGRRVVRVSMEDLEEVGR